MLVAAIWLFIHHQRQLKDRAFLMREAVRNEDFMFRLPLKGMFFWRKGIATGT